MYTLKEDVLNRRPLMHWIDDYDIILDTNKRRVQNFCFGFDKHYIIDEEDLIFELGLFQLAI
ncbi:unnamed protein product [Debaryomyces fabryi]|nr:unnamed protein product [Debaryomyces fabryi]